MSKGFKIFLIIFLISFPIFWEMNVFKENLDEFLFWREMAENPQVLTAIANQQNLENELRKLRPIRDWRVEDLKIEAESAISVLVTLDEAERVDRVLYEKSGDKILPIASLTKLMTAYTVLRNYNLDELVEISEEAVREKGDFGNLKIGEKLTVKDLLYILLTESSNDAAQALAEMVGRDAFTELMNLEAKNLNLKNTFFVNSTGLDPDQITDQVNYSTAKDLVRFTRHLLFEPLIWEILSTFEFDLYSPDGVFHHKLQNTNQLLKEDLGWKIIGGKTGWTPRSQGCLLLVLEAPRGKGFLINVILGSENRFEEMKNLVNWLHEAYNW